MRFLISILVFTFSTTIAFAQRPEVQVTITEQFFDSAIEAVFRSGEPPTHVLREGTNGDGGCNESVRLSRESDGVRTAVRFRDGRILAPIAFDGNYRIPVVGCIGFRGWAQTEINLTFDQANQQMVARAKVLDVSLNGTAGIGRTVVTRMVQNAIDERFDPLVVIGTERFSFGFPMQPTGSLSVKAVSARHVVRNGAIDLFIGYEFARI